MVVLDRNFMCILQHDTFDHEPFRKGKPTMYSTDDIDRFDADFKNQIHFNFAATRKYHEAEIVPGGNSR